MLRILRVLGWGVFSLFVVAVVSFAAIGVTAIIYQGGIETWFVNEDLKRQHDYYCEDNLRLKAAILAKRREYDARMWEVVMTAERVFDLICERYGLMDYRH